MKFPRIAVALVVSILLSPVFAGPVFAKGSGVSREPSRFFEGVPRTTTERSAEQPTYPFRAPRKGSGCTGLFESLCN